MSAVIASVGNKNIDEVENKEELKENFEKTTSPRTDIISDDDVISTLGQYNTYCNFS